MEQSVSLTRQQKQWNKFITHHIDRYSNLRDWSQLAAWLNKLKNHIQQYKSVVVDKNILLKKLATSLSPALPVALHQLTLDIYQILFNNIITNQQLELTCLGLFSFYTNANLKNKQRIIQIFAKFFPNFGKDLRILSSGLIITILPSYIQMNQPLVKQVTIFLQLISKNQLLGEQILIQSIWVSISRSASCRVAGLKFLSNKIGKGDQQDDNDQEDTFWQDTQIKKQQFTQSFQDNQIIQKKQKQQPKNIKDIILRYCPHIQTVVVNALLNCLQDSNVLAVKNALDFLFKYLPLKSQMIQQKAKAKLTRAIVYLLAKRDMSITRKINLWLFGKPDIQNKYNMIPKNIQFLTLTLIQYLQQTGQSNIEPLKIIFNLFSQHESLPSLILTSLSKQMITYCHRCQSNAQVLKLMGRIIDRVQGKTTLFAESLGKELIECIEKKQYRQAEKIIQLIMYLVNRILKPQQVKDLIFPIIKVMIQSYTITNWEENQYMKTAITQTLQIIQKFRDMILIKSQKTLTGQKQRKGSNQQSITNNNILQDIIFNDHINLYEKLVNIIKSDKNNQINGIYQHELVCINKMQLKIFQYFQIYSEKWVNILIKVIFLNNPNYFLQAIQVFGEALQKDSELKVRIIKETQIQNKESFVQVSIRKIWNILSLGHLQNRIIPILLRITKYFPLYFQKILDNQFSQSNQISIIKFSLLWSLAPKYTNIISHEQLQELCKPGLFRMLDYLDYGNPLVKYNSNIWINQCFPNFQRVLNPLLQILLKPKQFWYKTIQGQDVFVFEPDKQKIMNVLTHIKSIVKHTASKFYKFTLKPLTANLMPYYQIFRELKLVTNSSHNQGSNSENNKILMQKIQQKDQIIVLEGQQIYLNAIFQIIVKLAGSKYVGKQNPGIDLVACETLEVLVRNIPSTQLCVHIIERNLRNILKCLHYATVNRQHLLQIQLLNLLKIIFFQSNLRKNNNEQASKFLKQIISCSLFLKTIIEGLDTEFPYIKQRFVQFINLSIILIIEYHSNSSEIISKIFNTYCTKITLINSRKMQIQNKKDLQIGKRNTQLLILFSGIKQLLSYFLNLQIKQFQKEKNQNDADYGVFSLYSYKSFVSLKLQKKNLQSSKAKRIAQEISKQIFGQMTELFQTMTSCWSVSELMQYYKISMQGLSLFEYDEFHSYNKQLYLTLGRFQVEQSVENFVINLIRVLLNKYPRQVMNAMIQTWSSAKTVQLKIKIIEILNLASIPIQNFYNIMCQCLNSERISKKKRNNTLTFDNNGNLEQYILHFCQAFTHYNFQNFSVFQASNLINVWLSFLRFIKMFQQARNVQTIFGLIQLVDLFMKKNNPREIMKDQRIKKEFNYVLNHLNDIIGLCSGKVKVQCDQKKQYDFGAFIPLPSSIFDCFLVETGKKQDAKLQYLCFSSINAHKCEQYCRVYAFLISKRILYNLLMCFYRDQVSLIKKIREFIGGILPVIQDKSNDSLLIQNASQVLLSILQKKHVFLKQFKGDILQVFNKDDFFICSSRTLHCWVRIIDMIIDNNKDHDIFTQYLQKVSLVSSIFSSYSLETKKKIKSFQRICFILYAGKKDKYNDKAHLLIDKVMDVIKNTDAPQPVLILIFFCLRILILRMSPQKLSKLFANLWQMIMFLLVNIFKQPVKQQSRLNLVWAALKLIEMVSIMQMSEFHQHQWMFFYDFIGLIFKQNNIDKDKDINVNVNVNVNNQISTPNKKTYLNIGSIVLSQMSANKSSKIIEVQKQIEMQQQFELSHKPMISRFLPPSCIISKFSVNQIQEERHLIIKEDKIDDIELLNTKALLLSSYLVNNNEQRMKFKMSQIQELIENDFLNLDEFIFKFK